MTGALVRDILRQHPARSHTARSLLTQYMRYSVVSRVLGKLAFIKFQKRSKFCGTLQEDLLRDIIKSNQDSVYSKMFGLNEQTVSSLQQLQSVHPLTTYEDFRPFIDRMVEGENGVLTTKAPEYFATTSGTTGKCKKCPITADNTRRIIRGGLAMMYRHREVYKSLKRVWQFRVMSEPTRTKDGVLMTGMSNVLSRPSPHNIVPDACTRLYTERPSFHVQAVFALAEPELFFIDGFSSNLMCSILKFLEANHTQICEDISRGIICEDLDLPDDVRAELNAALLPNPIRATFIEDQIHKGSAGLAKRIWPELEYVHVGTSAGMKLCADMLRGTYLHGTTVFQTAHGASEAFVGYQTEDNMELEVLTMLPDATTVMEFIPKEHCDEDQPKTFAMDQVSVTGDGLVWS